MDFEKSFSDRSPAVKRLLREAMEMKESTEDCSARPVDDNLFEWHFTIKGPSGSDFEGGIYHGRLLFPSEYPMKPPDIMLLTPNGRFETNRKICLSISGHHPEMWLPSWSVRTALLALIAFMPAESNGTIGSLDYSAEERQLLARKSQAWECKDCGKIKHLLITESNHQEDDTKNLDPPKEQPQTAAKNEAEKTCATEKPREAESQNRTNGEPANSSSVVPPRLTFTLCIDFRRMVIFLTIGAIFLLAYRRMFLL